MMRSTPLSSSVGQLSIPNDSSDILDTSTSEPEPVTSPSYQSTDSNNIGEGNNLEPGPASSQPFESSFGDTKS